MSPRAVRSLACLLLAACVLGAGEAALDTALIERETGWSGTLSREDGVFRISAPRTDVPVTVDGEPLPPFMGLTSWASFMPGRGSEAMLMGDLVLFQDEVAPAMGALLDAGIAVTALHNHFVLEEPRVFFLHVGGEGRTATLAGGLRKGIDAVAAVRARNPRPRPGSTRPPLPTQHAIDAATLRVLLRADGQSKDGMFKAVIGRTATMSCGCVAGREMGVNSWAAFMGTMDSAAVSGDVATVAGELQPVLRALRRGGIEVTAIHSHMEGETPRYIFVHFWGVGRAVDLAKTIRTALDAQAAAAPPAGR